MVGALSDQWGMAQAQLRQSVATSRESSSTQWQVGRTSWRRPRDSAIRSPQSGCCRTSATEGGREWRSRDQWRWNISWNARMCLARSSGDWPWPCCSAWLTYACNIFWRWYIRQINTPVEIGNPTSPMTSSGPESDIAISTILTIIDPNNSDVACSFANRIGPTLLQNESRYQRFRTPRATARRAVMGSSHATG